jgi:signal transduction histidine kinase
VLGDPERTAQILAALLDNALRFTPPGVGVEVSARAQDGRACATVTDTGPGIAPEHLPRVFDRFYRVEASRTRSEAGGGTGLGLSIARELARAQGGELTAANAPDGGARFTLSLPNASP